MIFYYIRHGDPIYSPDSLTEYGHKQANALAKRFALYGLDEIYCSPTLRAKQTAQPTCDLLKKEMKILDWTDEGCAYREFSVEIDGCRNWTFFIRAYIEKYNSPTIQALGKNWYDHSDFLGAKLKDGITRIDRETDAFFLSLGFKHNRERNVYEVVEQNEKRIALFAHQGFGLAFLSSILDIPYPTFCTRFDIGHSAVTVIYFNEKERLVYPKILQISNDSHLYKEGILKGYQGWIDI